MHTFAVLHQQWVEASDGLTRRWKNCERKIHNSRQMVILAFIAVLIKRF
jgi:hypothetical protein